MGCCNDDKKCPSNKRKKRTIPWFSLTIGVLLILAIFHWQALKNGLTNQPLSVNAELVLCFFSNNCETTIRRFKRRFNFFRAVC